MLLGKSSSGMSVCIRYMHDAQLCAGGPCVSRNTGVMGQKPDVITHSVHVSARKRCQHHSQLPRLVAGQSHMSSVTVHIHFYWRVLKTNSPGLAQVMVQELQRINQPKLPTMKEKDHAQMRLVPLVVQTEASASDNTHQPTPSTQPQLALFKQVLCTNRQPANQLNMTPCLAAHLRSHS